MCFQSLQKNKFKITFYLFKQETYLCSNLSKDSWWCAHRTTTRLHWLHLVLLCLNLIQENLNLTRLVRQPLPSFNNSTSEQGASCPTAPRNTVNVFIRKLTQQTFTVPLHTLTYLSGYGGWMQLLDKM